MGKCQRTWLDYNCGDFKQCGKETENKERDAKEKIIFICHDCVKRQKMMDEAMKKVRMA
jgi:hypothetical protein